MCLDNTKKDIHSDILFVLLKSARRGSNPRPSPWQGDAPPLSHSRIYMKQSFHSAEAGDGNRTHVSSLEGQCSTIELHPHIYKTLSGNAQSRNRTSDTRIFSPLLYQLSYLGPSFGDLCYFTAYTRICQQIFQRFYHLIFNISVTVLTKCYNPQNRHLPIQ